MTLSGAETSSRATDPLWSSWYVDPALYETIRRDVATWAGPSQSVPAEQARAIEDFLVLEAALLDGGQLRSWLGLMAPHCVYWMPTVVENPDPTIQLCTAFDDRRRLEDRVVRLETGTAYSQLPPSRTCRTIANFRYWPGDALDEVRVRCAFTVHESRAGELRILAGWYGYVLRSLAAERAALRAADRHLAGIGSRFEIVRKQVDLLEADVHLRNLTFVL